MLFFAIDLKLVKSFCLVFDWERPHVWGIGKCDICQKVTSRLFLGQDVAPGQVTMIVRESNVVYEETVMQEQKQATRTVSDDQKYFVS